MADARRDARAALEAGTVDALLMDAISPIRLDASAAGPPEAAVVDAERISMDGPRAVADADSPTASPLARIEPTLLGKTAPPDGGASLTPIFLQAPALEDQDGRNDRTSMEVPGSALF